MPTSRRRAPGGGAPPWWPEGQDWPPRRGRRRGPARFVRFVFLFVVFWVVLTSAVGGLVGEAVAQHSGAFFWPAVLFALGLVYMAMRAGRGGRFRRLAEAARRLEATDERRRTFLADLAHEMRTPLAVVKAQAEAISEGVYPGDAAHLAPILEATGAMEALMADLRTLAESDAGALELKREPVPVADLLRETVAARPGVTLDPVPEPLVIDGDPARLRRVLDNLLNNALAHTPGGGLVRLSAAKRGSEVEILVADSGSGVDPAVAGRAFERFAKGPASRGSGLGLSIARDIVAAHGGTIALEPNPGGGTIVRLALPGA